MGKIKKIAVSKCCEAGLHIFPAVNSMGSPAEYYCSKCLKECEIKQIEEKKKNE
jgi:hypothetical protein